MTGGADRAGGRQVLAEAEGRLFAALGVEHRSHQVALDGGPVARARVLEVGAGPPVLLVHGAGVNAAVWAPLMARLAHRRCLAVDLPGCGLTDPFDYRGVDLRAHARAFLASLLDALELDAAPVVGNSLGGAFALYLAAAEPGRVQRLVLLGATGVALPAARGTLAMRLYSRPALGRVMSAVSPPIRPELARRLLVSICGRRAVEAVPGAMFDVMASAMRLSEPTTRTLMPALFSRGSPRAELSLSTDELAGIAAPTRFVWGSRDGSQGPGAAERAVAAMPRAALTVLDAGHHPWWDDAAGCAALVDRHLEEGAVQHPGEE